MNRRLSATPSAFMTTMNFLSITRGRVGAADGALGGTSLNVFDYAAAIGLVRFVQMRASRQGLNDKNYSDSLLRESKRRSTVGSSTTGGGVRKRRLLNRAHPDRSVGRSWFADTPGAA
jgi:hypothetical protein